MRLSSPAFGDGGPIPSKHTADGCNSSPAIRWHDVPDAAAELVLILESADALAGGSPVAQPAIHWLVYKIPADSEGLPAGVPPHDQLTTPPGALQGVNDFPSNDSIGYYGPPAHGRGAQRYRFRLYALDEPLELAPAERCAAVLRAMSGHVIAETSLMIRDARPAAA